MWLAAVLSTCVFQLIRGIILPIRINSNEALSWMLAWMLVWMLASSYKTLATINITNAWLIVEKIFMENIYIIFMLFVELLLTHTYGSEDSLELSSINVNVTIVRRDVMTIIVLYLLLSLKFHDCKKREELVTNIISNVICCYFVFTNDYAVLISYYWYDLWVSTTRKDAVIITHHLITMLALFQTPSNLDYFDINQLVVFMKSTDVLMHHYKIISILQLNGLIVDNTKWSKYKLFALCFTIVSWIFVRVVYATSLMPLQTTLTNILLPVFVLGNLFWIYKMLVLFNKERRMERNGLADTVE
jgi:hypothetical protein